MQAPFLVFRASLPSSGFFPNSTPPEAFPPPHRPKPTPAPARPVPAGTTFRCEAANGFEGDGQRAVTTGEATQRNLSPVDHIRCRITASLRATAMVAFLEPMRRARDRPHACRSLGLADRLRTTF